MKFRHVFWPLLPAFVFGFLLALELGYRLCINLQFARLERRVIQAHPSWIYDGPEFARFGSESTKLGSSLLEDGWAWLCRKVHRVSPLDYYDVRSSHAYVLARFQFDDKNNLMSHVFVWSPRRMAFVHWANWESDCGEPACPYQNDPRP